MSSCSCQSSGGGSTVHVSQVAVIRREEGELVYVHTGQASANTHTWTRGMFCQFLSLIWGRLCHFHGSETLVSLTLSIIHALSTLCTSTYVHFSMWEHIDMVIQSCLYMCTHMQIILQYRSVYTYMYNTGYQMNRKHVSLKRKLWTCTKDRRNYNKFQRINIIQNMPYVYSKIKIIQEYKNKWEQLEMKEYIIVLRLGIWV